MILVPDLAQVACVSEYCVRYQYLLFLIIPFIIFTVWMIRRTSIRFKNRLEQKEYLQSRKTLRKIVLFFRILSFTLLIIALASPFILTDATVPGNPRLIILIDNSTSMDVYNTQIASDLFSQLDGVIPVKVRTIASYEESALGTGILNHLEGDENLLVITDGQSNKGKLLGDVMLFASTINTTISTMHMQTIENDVGVTIEGPSEMIKDNEATFKVRTNNVGQELSYTITVTVDGQDIALNEQTSGSQEFDIPRRFSDPGYHTITAEITGVDDYFEENNKFHKTMKVVQRPNILFVSQQNSPLLQQLNRLYAVDSRTSIPSSLDNYMAVIVDNQPASVLLPSIDQLTTYVEEGNGLMIIGGDRAYESGGYKGTLVESLLPVTMGSGEEGNQSDVNIVVTMDISLSTREEIPLQKALAISVVDSLDDTNNVGAVAFNSDAYEIEPIKPLDTHEEEIKDKISRLAFDGQSMFQYGLQGAWDLLEHTGGGKNIIFISDGYTTYDKLRQDTFDTVRNLNARGVTVYTVGVGSSRDNLFLDNIARLGGGIYFPADESNKLSVLFGNQDPNQDPDYFNSITILDTQHFITQNLEPTVTLSGYNYVIPKPVSRLLVSTNKNIPILVVWRFGLGRVVSLATDDGSRWAGEMLTKKNSELLSKSVNWAIGDLSRKKSFDVTIQDTTLDEPAFITVVAKELPKEKDILFAKIDTNTYAAEAVQTQTGYFTALGATGAVNYKREYQRLGVSEEFTTLVNATGGKIFAPEDTQGIIEFVKANSKRIKIESIDLRWPFLVAAIIIFLIEIAIRRMFENRGEQ